MDVTRAQRKVLLIQRYIAKRSAEQRALKRGFKDAAVQREIAKNKAALKYQFWILAQAKADVQDIIEEVKHGQHTDCLPYR